MEDKFKLSPPWVTYVKELRALFEEDPAIKIDYDEDKNEVKLYVEGQEKADAISQILPAEKYFGNVPLYITVVPANAALASKASVIKKAFDGNPCLKDVFVVSKGVYTGMAYVVFENKVVQFFNDNLSDINGNMSTLYEDIARDILVNTDRIFFCTAASDGKLAKPLGEWP